MKRLFVYITGGGILPAMFLLAPVSYLFAGEQVTIEGIVYGANWDDEGNTTAVVIVAEGVEYIVADSGQGRKLLTLEGKTIKATGTVEENEVGDKVITITSYQVIEESFEEVIIEQE